MYRTSAGTATRDTKGSTGTVPNIWVKLVRASSNITASSSPDGINWTKIGSGPVPMASNCYIGLVVSSGGTAVLNASVFDNVVVVP